MATADTQTFFGITLAGTAWGVVIGAAITVTGAIITAAVNQGAALLTAKLTGQSTFRNTVLLEFNRDRTKMLHECWGSFVGLHDACEDLLLLRSGGVTDPSDLDRKAELVTKYVNALNDVRKYRIWSSDLARDELNAYIAFMGEMMDCPRVTEDHINQLGVLYRKFGTAMKKDLFEIANWGA